MMMESKELPHSIKSEQALLGCILSNTETIYNLDTHAHEFYKFHHQNLYQEIKDHSLNNQSWDSISLYDHLVKENKMTEVGGLHYFMELQDLAMTAVQIKYYARQVKEMYELRREIKIYREALEETFNGSSKSDSVIAKLMGKPAQVDYNIEKIIENWKLAQQGVRTCIPTPYESMDRQTGGIKQGMVTIFTGRSKSGKSMFLASWYNYLGKNNIPILVVPLEDKYDVTIKRMAGNLGNFKVSDLDTGGRYKQNRDNFNAWEYYKTEDKEIENASVMLKEVNSYPVHFWDRKCTPAQLRGIAVRYKRQHDIQAMFIDGAKDLLRPSGKYADVGFDEEISQQLCAIAEELDIAVVSVHHLTKIHEDERINVNHIRGSGNIVGDARAVYALQSSGIEGLLTDKGYQVKWNDEGKLTNRIFECLVNNHGGSAMKALDSDLNKCQFYELRK